MKKALYFLLTFLAVGCDKEIVQNLPECTNCTFTCVSEGEPDAYSNDCISDWNCQYNLFEDAEIVYSNGEYDGTATVKPGSNLVFEAILETDGSPMIADDEVTKSLYFEVNAGQESFSVEGDDLNLLNVRYQRSCYCTDVRFKQPVSGCMQGQKIDETHWKVQANLEVSYDNGSIPFKLDAVFVK
jgi:hypothetical protein